LRAVQASDNDQRGSGSVAAPAPGLVVVFHGPLPTLRSFRVSETGIVLGRDLLGDTRLDDRLSRQHARVRWHRDRFVVTDLSSRNGTFIGGHLMEHEMELTQPSVVRTGRTISVLYPDVRGFEGGAVEHRDGIIVGPTLGAAWAALAQAGRRGESVLLVGESGTGKDLAARAFHRASGKRGELVTVQCASLSPGQAERVLFGSRRSAFAGSDRDGEGQLAAAHRGTLCLDDVGALEPQVQAKLWRAMEGLEPAHQGAPQHRTLDVRVVATTTRDLAAEVAAGRFREELYVTLARNQIVLPPLRERIDDLAYLVTATVSRATPSLSVHASLIEACLLRRWAGNVRELHSEIRRAALAAAEGSIGMVRAGDLEEERRWSDVANNVHWRRGAAGAASRPPATRSRSQGGFHESRARRRMEWSPPSKAAAEPCPPARSPRPTRPGAARFIPRQRRDLAPPAKPSGSPPMRSSPRPCASRPATSTAPRACWACTEISSAATSRVTRRSRAPRSELRPRSKTKIGERLATPRQGLTATCARHTA
jgi:Sigma-54 interaction domain/FHA domain